MLKSTEVPDCHYPNDPTLVRPTRSPPRRSLYLSNLDDQKFLRFSIKYMYLFRKSLKADALKASLSRVLEDYYPLAGRLRNCDREEKLELDCNGEGAVFAEGLVDLTVDAFLAICRRPNASWRKLLYKIDAQSFLGVPPLVVQVTYLSCGGMVVCTAFSHCVCDGIGSAQFLRAWAHYAANSESRPSISPFHSRHALKPRPTPSVSFSHPEYTPTSTHISASSDFLAQILQSQPLVPVYLTFDPSEILQLKKQCVPSLKCTSFEALASHVWRSWIRSIGSPPELRVKLLFSVNVRERLKPPLPCGFYGNGFVLACAEGTAGELVESNPRRVVELVQSAKARVDNDYVRSAIDFLEENRVLPDLSATLVISQWSKLGLEDIDFGEGGPLHVSPLTSEIYCIFLPVIGNLHAFAVLLSVPEPVANKFEYHMKNLWSEQPGKDRAEEAFA